MTNSYKAPKAPFWVEGGHIRTDGSIRRKVSGTAMGGILGVSPWSSPFQAACGLLGLADKDLDNKPAVIAGQELEVPIIRYAAEAYPEKGSYFTAEEIFGKKEGPHEAWAADFEDPVFTGHVDGLVVDSDGDNHILEIKTSGNMDMWKGGVPAHYYWQVALYDRFVAHTGTAYLVLGITDAEALRNPATWAPSPENVTLFNIDIDTDEVEETLDYVRGWWHEYIEKGVTPEYDPGNEGDVELYNRLVGLAADPEDVSGLVAHLADVKMRIEAHEESARGLYDTYEALKDRVREYMDAHNDEMLASADGGWQAVLSTRTTRTIDARKLRAAGLDPDDYTTVKTSKIFSIKPVRTSKE